MYLHSVRLFYFYTGSQAGPSTDQASTARSSPRRHVGPCASPQQYAFPSRASAQVKSLPALIDVKRRVVATATGAAGLTPRNRSGRER